MKGVSWKGPRLARLARWPNECKIHRPRPALVRVLSVTHEFRVTPVRRFLPRVVHRPTGCSAVRSTRNTLLLLASYYFYGSWDPRFLLLIWLVTGASYLAGSRIAASADPLERKRWLIGYATFAMALLGVFKYLDFFIGSAQSALSALGFNSRSDALADFAAGGDLVLHVRIAQLRDRDSTSATCPAPPASSTTRCSLAYFPKLVAGPIERPAVLVPQIQKTAHHDRRRSDPAACF